MRKTTEKTAAAFLARRPAKMGNTSTDGEALYLHGHAIARHTPDGLQITLAGWNTATTRDRVSGVLHLASSGPCPHGCGVSTKQGTPRLHDKRGITEIDSHEWVTVAL
jgi:hypothetical protein